VSTRRSAPIWAQPAPGSRKPRFTREQIAEIAIRIADTDGFEALSMRRIAEELDAGTMTLYHYVRTKDDLIDLMDDTLMGQTLIPPAELGRDWVAALSAIARATHRVFVLHPWALSALRGARFSPNSLLHVEQSMAAVARAPFDLPTRLDILGIVDDYVFGFVFRSGEVREDFADGPPSSQVTSFIETQLATGRYPHLVALAEAGETTTQTWHRMAKLMSNEQRFERGLCALLEGLRRTIVPVATPRKPRKR
jgi:AcrR family transcriptional regulator